MSQTVTIPVDQLENLLRRTVAKEVSKVIAANAKVWLSMPEACQHANCSPSKLRQLIASGRVIASNVGIKGATVSINRKSIESYHESQKYNPIKWKK